MQSVPPSQPPPPPMDVPPNQTLFCHNLNTKVHRRELRSLLYELFSAYGKIVDIVASKHDPKKRGNGFVVFAEIGSATMALKQLAGFQFLGRPLKIAYAKKKSDRIAILEGTYKIKRKETASNLVSPIPPSRVPLGPSAHLKPAEIATLCVENIPSIMNEAALSVLFNQYPGFVAARVVSGRGIGFVDFVNDFQAELAMQGLDGFLVTTDHALKVSVSKKSGEA